jgi:hypothetical protein
MAQNQLLDLGLKVSVIPTNGAQTSGAPGRYGVMTGVALNNVLADTTVSMNCGFAVWNLLVDAHTAGAAGSAIAVGDAIFYTDATTNASHLNKDSATGYFFGYAMGANAVASTATVIPVAHVPGGGVLASLGVGTAQLAAAAVTGPKLSPTLKKGFIPLPLQAWRDITAGLAIDTKANVGGLGASDSVPLLARVNVGTDPTMRLSWVATGVLPVQFSIISPPDLDPGTMPILKIYAAMGGGTDTCTLTTGIFEGVGGSTKGGTTIAVVTATPAVYSQAFASLTATSAVPLPWSIVLTPGAHANDALYMYQAWIEYGRL